MRGRRKDSKIDEKKPKRKVKSKKTKLKVTTKKSAKSIHSITSSFSKTSRLKAEYRNLSKPELIKMFKREYCKEMKKDKIPLSILREYIAKKVLGRPKVSLTPGKKFGK